MCRAKKPLHTPLAYGVMAATVVTLILIPCLYSLGDDLRVRLAGPHKVRIETD